MIQLKPQRLQGRSLQSPCLFLSSFFNDIISLSKCVSLFYPQAWKDVLNPLSIWLWAHVVEVKICTMGLLRKRCMQTSDILPKIPCILIQAKLPSPLRSLKDLLELLQCMINALYNSFTSFFNFTSVHSFKRRPHTLLPIHYVLHNMIRKRLSK